MPHSATLQEKQRREEHQQRAYEIQLAGGLQGAARWTVYGTIACAMGHFAYPPFARQTLGLKAFLVSSATIFGLVVGADNHLLKYESHLREAENDIRRQARAELALEGRIASETEIRKWREANKEKLAIQAEIAARGAT
ncbi:uncharacterized protein I206_107437 [Kwoniella pini CBS 10737]|uniref:Respiratory supercomplex factor 1, mitochondrial n=1 Tax=Kwoniella pini CBS 10737 TaxID=1296096 RepID=A0A1B9HXA6_9TREE|nr:uncharacterized protein I206_05764 [Kwoniella pini CBS 10737]OCF47900.1 hypothetical protein I206_05764 [Kwoniella pini CBS 10737]